MVNPVKVLGEMNERFIDERSIVVNVINQNDNLPIFTEEPKFFVSEDALIGDIIGSVIATDADIGLFG